MRNSTILGVLVIITLGAALAFFHILTTVVALQAVLITSSVLLILASLPLEVRAWWSLGSSRSRNFDCPLDSDPIDILLATYTVDNVAAQNLNAILNDLLFAAERRSTSGEITTLRSTLSATARSEVDRSRALDDDLLQRALSLLEESWNQQ
ncbi:hypothetical protein [Ferrimicrobium sp.]|uniref:hypothetical protein n=1 Tax=Ferrimicrobium sp. TaxID=2926050 RepID=UPI0026123338|nr:hypothetical protein [Ferrimicrobium sp.]